MVPRAPGSKASGHLAGGRGSFLPSPHPRQNFHAVEIDPNRPFLILGVVFAFLWGSMLCWTGPSATSWRSSQPHLCSVPTGKCQELLSTGLALHWGWDQSGAQAQPCLLLPSRSSPSAWTPGSRWIKQAEAGLLGSTARAVGGGGRRRTAGSLGVWADWGRRP